MAELSGKERTEYVQSMFSHLARRYDRANRWMSWGQDRKWRREVLKIAQLPDGGGLLDIGTGTGDLALEAYRQDPEAMVVGADLTPQMMQLGRKRDGGSAIHWINADAHRLPYKGEVFDAVVSGYLLRNVMEVEQALAEQYRVLKTGGKVVCLDATFPPDDILHLPVRLYLRYAIPIIGFVIAGDFHSYQYLPASAERFLRAQPLAACMQQVGFRDVQYHCFMGGSMAIHWGIK